MIYSRSPEQYDRTPFVDSAGRRYSNKDAPRGSQYCARSHLVASDDMTPVMDLETGSRISVETAEKLILESPELYLRFRWLPHSGDAHRHNGILSSIRKARKDPSETIELFRLWVTTLETFPANSLIALSPGLDEKKISEALLVLKRLLNIHTKEDA